jgi:hypothetical protein
MTFFVHISRTEEYFLSTSSHKPPARPPPPPNYHWFDMMRGSWGEEVHPNSDLLHICCTNCDRETFRYVPVNQK